MIERVCDLIGQSTEWIKLAVTCGEGHRLKSGQGIHKYMQDLKKWLYVFGTNSFKFKIAIEKNKLTGEKKR